MMIYSSGVPISPVAEGFVHDVSWQR